MPFSLGADPEFFLSLDGDPVSAHELVPGTKDLPFKLDNGAVQLDGTAVEFNIDPAYTAKEFEYNIHSVLSQVRKMIPIKYKFNFSPTVFYSDSYFDEQIPDGPKELGCNPDFRTKYGVANPRPHLDGKYRTMRTAAGHLHVGFVEQQVDHKNLFSKEHLWDCAEVVKYLDYWYSMYKIGIEPNNERQKLYGAMGSYRPKPYGVEYRVPANSWLNYPKLWPWMFNEVERIVDGMKEGYTMGNGMRYDQNFKKFLLAKEY